MASLYGVNYTKFLTGPTEANISVRGTVSGPVHYMYDSYEASATSAADVIYMGHKLNAGDIILGFILSCDDLSGVASPTIDVGTLANDDEFASAIDVSTAAVTGNHAMLVDGIGYVVGTAANDDIIMLTLNTAATTGTIKLLLMYSKC
jgi:hypothetical protein